VSVDNSNKDNFNTFWN